MMWLFAIVIVLVMGAIAVVAAGRGEEMAPAYDDRPDAFVPAGRPLAGEDLRRTRFSLAFRGYRMSEVDELLARLATQLDPPAAPAEAATEPAAGTPAEGADSSDASADLDASDGS